MGSCHRIIIVPYPPTPWGQGVLEQCCLRVECAPGGPKPGGRPLLLSSPVFPGASSWRFFPECFRFFSVVGKTVKKRTAKKSTCSGNFTVFGVADVDFRLFWVPKRVSGESSRGVFRLCFPDAVLHRFSVVFSVKNVTSQKMKKCV